MRATPYCRLSPSAISPYIPPSSRPLRNDFEQDHAGAPCAETNGPGRTAGLTRSQRAVSRVTTTSASGTARLGAGLVGREEADELAVLPLADRPGMALSWS